MSFQTVENYRVNPRSFIADDGSRISRPLRLCSDAALIPDANVSRDDFYYLLERRALEKFIIRVLQRPRIGTELDFPSKILLNIYPSLKLTKGHTIHHTSRMVYEKPTGDHKEHTYPIRQRLICFCAEGRRGRSLVTDENGSVLVYNRDLFQAVLGNKELVRQNNDDTYSLFLPILDVDTYKRHKAYFRHEKGIEVSQEDCGSSYEDLAVWYGIRGCYEVKVKAEVLHNYHNFVNPSHRISPAEAKERVRHYRKIRRGQRQKK